LKDRYCVGQHIFQNTGKITNAEFQYRDLSIDKLHSYGLSIYGQRAFLYIGLHA